MNRPLSSCLLILLLAIGSLPICFGQGSLTPPGPPGPTMKSLAEVEPRVAINDTNTPGDGTALFKITQPGSYYLTGNITGVEAKVGIAISVGGEGPGVTLDLMGFEVTGVPGSRTGIAVVGGNARNVSIRNGTVRAWGSHGIDISNSRNNQVTDVRVEGNSGRGIWSGAQSNITGCSVDANGSDGIRVGPGSTVSRCTASNNADDGIVAQFDCAVSGCAAGSNTGRGIVGDQGTSIVNSAASSNGSHGIAAVNVTNCASRFNDGNGINSSGTVSGCLVAANKVHGISASGGVVTGCQVSVNSEDGIRISSNVIATSNSCVSNGISSTTGAGIRATGNYNRIENNTTNSNDHGIVLDGTVSGNMVVRNYARGNSTANYTNPSGGNFIGTLTGTSAAMNASENSLLNISFP